jgi:hypothetical protein
LWESIGWEDSRHVNCCMRHLATDVDDGRRAAWSGLCRRTVWP